MLRGKQSLFIPRSVTTNSKKCDSKNQVSRQSNNHLTDSNNEDETAVKEFSSQQRWPDSEEPVCVICGKYGEYICDKTDEDICSFECKYKHLQTIKQSSEKQLCNKHSHSEHSNIKQESHYDATFTDNFDDYYLKQTHFQFQGSLTTQQNNFFREKLYIKINKTSAAGLMLDFSHILNGKLLENLVDNNFTKPTVVQMQAIPLALGKQDILVSSQTTSGKTACFLIPILSKIQKCLENLPSTHSFCKHPIALIIAPTRELCIQIEEQAKALSTGILNMKTALLIGGVPLPQQLHRLRHKIQLVIGTPGRINDILSKHEDFSVSQIKIVVLDEVDVMLHMGFHNQIKEILEVIPGQPQYMMFSATIPPETESLGRKQMIDPIFVSVGNSGAPNESIEQLIIWVDERSKKKKLFSIMDDGRHFLPPVLVFVDSKIGADMLCDSINERYRLRCVTLHSDKTQDERSQILSNFLTGSYDILVATNLMGRGLNLINVKQVILFDMPKTLDEYIHQIGRSGNLGNKGYAITFINNSSKHLFFDMKTLFDASGTKIPDEIRHSSYVEIEAAKRSRNAQNNSGRQSVKVKRNDIENDSINAQSLIEILTKKKRKV